MAAPATVEIFCSYAHEDEAWQQKLAAHLSLLRQQGLISFWHDRLIIPGTNWAKVIDAHLEAASVILLLVSVDFFASDYCVGIEMKRALERQEEGSAVVIPILVRPVDWQRAPFAHLQVLPTDARPLVSWLDEETALADVTAGIRRAIEALPMLSASIPRAALPTIWNIPYPRNPFFLGRESELAQIHKRLKAGQATALSQPQAISGLGGIGKTQLALEYAYRYHQDYQAVLWAHAESTDALISSYVALATLLQLPERETKEQEIVVQAVKIWLRTHRNWLLILDNADELTLLANFLPPSLGGHLLLTTRAAAIGRLAHRLEIEILLPEQGALLLLRRAGVIVPVAKLTDTSQEERELAVQLAEELGGLPLALDQAGAYLEETGVDLATYWHLYQQHRTALLRERRGLVADHPEPVATTWSLSFQRVEERNPAAAELLRVCAFLSPDAIPEEILTMGATQLGSVIAPVAADTFLFNQAIEALRAYSLVQRDAREKTFSVHRLVQAVLQEGQKQEEQRLWAERAMLAVNVAFPHAKYETWPRCERLLSHALLAAQFVEKFQINRSEAGRLLYMTAWYVKERARYQEAEQLYLHALHVQEQALGSEHADVARTLNGLAMLYMFQGDYARAEPLYQRALHIWELQGGVQNPMVAHALDNLGSLHSLLGKYTEAEQFYQRALHIRVQQLGSQDSLVARPLNNLANLYRDQGKYAEAEQFYQRALHIREQQLRAEDPEKAETMHDFARFWEVQGCYEEARALYARALAMRERALGAHHPKTTETRTCFIGLLQIMGLGDDHQ